jgi:hypothetical protein
MSSHYSCFSFVRFNELDMKLLFVLLLKCRITSSSSSTHLIFKSCTYICLYDLLYRDDGGGDGEDDDDDDDES